MRTENFDDVINTAEKNAFVLFCSSFCPWCQNYLNAPRLRNRLEMDLFGAEVTWTSLMEKHEGSKEVLVAHIDCGEPSYEMGEFLEADIFVDMQCTLSKIEIGVEHP